MKGLRGFRRRCAPMSARLFCRHAGLYRLMVIGRGLPLNNLDGIRRTSRQTVTQSIAVIILYEAGLAIEQAAVAAIR